MRNGVSPRSEEDTWTARRRPSSRGASIRRLVDASVGAPMIARTSVLTMAVLAGAIIGQRIQRWSFYKVAYNVGQFLLSITVAELIFGAFHAPSATHPLAWVAAVVAMFGYFVVNVGS